MNYEELGAGLIFIVAGAIGAFRPSWVVSFKRKLAGLAGSSTIYDRDPARVVAMRVGSILLMIIGLILARKGLLPVHEG